MASKRKTLEVLLLSLISTIAFCFLWSIEISKVFVFVVVFSVLSIFYSKVNYNKQKSVIILAVVLSFLLILGKYVVFIYESTGLMVWVKLLMTFVGAFLFLNRFLGVSFNKLEAYSNGKTKEFSNKKLFFISFAIILAAWIPAWLAEYPGIFTPDTIAQLNQAIGTAEYNNMNPLIHTFMLKLAYDFVSIFTKDINVCSFVVGMIQMVCNSLIYSYVIVYINKRTKNKILTIASIMFFALVSFNVFNNVTVSKDSAYAAFTALFVISIDKYCLCQSKRNAVLFVIISILYCLLRSNGYYSFVVVMAVLFLLLLKKNFKKTAILFLVAFILCTIIKVPVYNTILKAVNKSEKVINVELPNNGSGNNYKFRGNFLYVVPFQQVANVVVHDRELNEKEQWLIEEYMPLDKFKDVYDPILVDPLFDYITNHFKPSRGDISNIEYLKLWIELFLKYPQDYIGAYVNMNRYYYYPSRYVDMYYIGVANNSLGIERKPLISDEYTYEV